MIRLENAEKYFNKGLPNEVHALGPVDLQIGNGEFVVIIGSNGSGKSTLLNLISGTELSSKGTITLSNTQVTRLPEYKRSKWIARVFQNPLSGTAPELSILDNFRLAALRAKPKSLVIGVNNTFRHTVREHIAALYMGLEGKLDQPMGTLSGGQRQALTLLMAVMGEVKLLLLDEPTAALDPRSAELVMKTADHLINSYALTAILVTHNMKDASLYGNRIIQMAEGRIVRDINALEKAVLTAGDIFDWFV